MTIYNVMGNNYNLVEMLKAFPCVVATDRFNPNDINVELPDDPDYEEKFLMYCEEHRIKTRFI
jgi:hypothetical protein